MDLFDEASNDGANWGNSVSTSTIFNNEDSAGSDDSNSEVADESVKFQITSNQTKMTDHDTSHGSHNSNTITVTNNAQSAK